PPRPRGLLTHAEVIRRIGATDAGLRQTARAILQRHPEWAEPALGLFRQWLAKEALSQEERGGLRGLLLAFQQQPPVQKLAAEVLGRARLSDDQVLRLLGVLRGESLIAPAVLLPALQRTVTPQTARPLLKYLAESVRHGWRPGEPELRKVLQALPTEARGGG